MWVWWIILLAVQISGFRTTVSVQILVCGQTTRVGQQTTDISLPHLTQRHVVPAEVADDVAGLAGEGLGAVAGEP